ncbi:MAG: SMP-30/gluconolactonase/LRE family protein [Saprospiraceae bacterium]|nr:SMP-30/gluconolactonase/LRE family protein [Saprospiraceae bacterium]
MKLLLFHKIKTKLPFTLCAILSIVACDTPIKEDESVKQKEQSFIIRLSPELDSIISTSATLDTLAEGFIWSEGPLWLESEQALLFTDVPKNVIYRWSESDGLSTYLEKSGYLGERTDKHEAGANGLILDQNGNLILCQHGERQVARMKASLTIPEASFEPLANMYEGTPLNSPNDLVQHSNGTIFFTDPPYGLDPWDTIKLDFAGVYSLDTNGNLMLVIDSLSMPNGIALSGDESKLYVAVSDLDLAAYYVYDLDATGKITSGKLLLDVTDKVKSGLPGLPDGLKVHPSGNIFATGPGGILVIASDGKHLGTIDTGQPTANCAFNADYSQLYMTAHKYLMRLKLK